MSSPVPTLTVPVEYRPLHKYLKDRFADTVVLTFAEIEDLMGCALPDLAVRQAEWWANADPSGAPSAQARSWTQAGRTATPHVLARSVTFNRA